jgi:predicted transcriptional regulator
MTDVKNVFITKEVSEILDINPSYLIRVAKALLENGNIKSSDMRSAGKRNYLFNEKAIEEIRKSLKK